VIVPNKNLVEQTLEDYQNVGLNVGVIFGDRKEFDRQHTICTWQSLNVLDKKNKDALDDDQLAVFLDQQVAVIVDECHGVKDLGVLHRLLTTTFSNIPIRWGLTGTVPEAEYNQMSLFTAIGPLIGQLQARDLQDAGHLAQCQVHVHQTQETQVYQDYQSELKFLLTNNDRLKWVSDFVKTISATGNTLVLVDRIATGTALHNLIADSTFISGEMKSSDRREHYKEINLSDNAVMIATYGTTAVGISINRIFNLVLIEPGKSFVRVIQSIGRGLRKADDKDHVDIYDICSKMKFSHRHMLKRQQHYKKVQYPHALTKENY
jgi:superfamily II DNA or RNA helicase